MRGGKGKLYLGFFVDPIHRVHWNNLAGPVTVEVNGTSHVGPRVTKADADADPRELIVDVSTSEPIKVKLLYTGCDDKETWCRELIQEFVVSLEIDPDAGRVAGAGRERGAGRGPGGRRGDGR